jgi:rod shape-determining protein MreC
VPTIGKKSFIRRYSLWLTAVGLLLASYYLVSVSRSSLGIAQVGTRVVDTMFLPLQRSYLAVTNELRRTWEHYIWLIGVAGERDELLSRLRELEAKNSQLIELESENNRLRGLLNVTTSNSWDGVSAVVIGRDHSNWVREVTINKGSSAGIRRGQPVMDGHGIVGQVITVAENSSRILLITDSSSAIDAIVQSCRASGVVEGGLGSSTTVLRYIMKSKDYPVRIGDRVIASGLDGVYPKGALVGVVKKVDANSSGMYQYIEIQPSADVERLENVVVLTNFGGGTKNSGGDDPKGADQKSG